MSFPGYVRLYDDRSSYTGVHKNGGPTTIDAHRVDLKNHLDRSPADMRGVKVGLARSPSGRASWGSNVSAASSPSKDANSSLNSSFRFDRSESGRRLGRSSSSSGREWAADTSVSRAASGRSLTTMTPTGARRTASGKDLMTFKDLKRTRSGTLLCVHNKAKNACLQCGGWAHGTSPNSTSKSPKRDEVYGPERFYHDRSTWGGTHKNGGPSTIDSFRVDLSQHLDRSEADVRGVKIAMSRDDVRNAARNGGSARDLMAMRTRSAGGVPAGAAEFPFARKEVILDDFPEPLYPGYVRHFHDKSTYTGVHKNGGPSTVDSFTIDLKRHVTRGASARARTGQVWDKRGFVGVNPL